MGLLKSEAEKEREEHQRVIDGFAGSDDKLSAEEVEALRLYKKRLKKLMIAKHMISGM